MSTTLERVRESGELCRYCAHFDHWVPARSVDSGPSAEECPLCGGAISMEEPAIKCRFCDSCLSYVPLRLWQRHVACCR